MKFTKKHKEIFEKLGVDVIYLFGSYVAGRVHPMSDVDIGVVFSDPRKYCGANNMMAYSPLYDIIMDLLPADYKKARMKIKRHDFDLVFLQEAPIELQLAAIERGKVLYMKNEEAEAKYRESVSRRMADFSYFLNIRKQAILDRI